MLNFAFIFLFIWTEGLSKFTLPCCVGLCRYKWVSWFLDKYFKFDLIKYSKEYLIMYSKVDLIKYSKEDLMKYSKEDLINYSKEPTWLSLPAPTQPCPTWRGYFNIRVAQKKPVSRNQRQMWIANKHIFFFYFDHHTTCSQFTLESLQKLLLGQFGKMKVMTLWHRWRGRRLWCWGEVSDDL